MEIDRKGMSPPLAKDDADRDSVAGSPGSSSTGAGAKAGRTTGAAIGGAIGHAVGVGKDVVAGAISGGITAGKNAGQKAASTAPVDPAAEHEYWRTEFERRPYVEVNTPYDQYGPAFQYGWEACLSHQGKPFGDAEAELERNWESRRGQSTLSWDQARSAVRDAWQRLEDAMRGDCCISE